MFFRTIRGHSRGVQRAMVDDGFEFRLWEEGDEEGRRIKKRQERGIFKVGNNINKVMWCEILSFKK